MEKDVSWKEYFRDDERYADVINGIGFGGRTLVTGENLEEADSQTIFGGLQDRSLGIAITGGRKRMRRIRTRDMLRKVAFGVSFAMIGLENQELVDYAMPLRCMIYDAGEYEKQAGKIRKMLRKQKGLRGGEYLYGFGKDSKLCPVVTFVLYSGREQWDGPRSLHDMLDIEGLPEEMREQKNSRRLWSLPDVAWKCYGKPDKIYKSSITNPHPPHTNPKSLGVEAIERKNSNFRIEEKNPEYADTVSSYKHTLFV